MKKDKFLYTDGRHVVVTQSTLQVKNAEYQLRGITNFGMAVITAPKLPGLIITLIGLTLVANAFFHFIPSTFFDSIYFPSLNLMLDSQIIIGGTVIIAGLALLIFATKRYALRIQTADGNKNVVVSRKREYVDQILHAIRKARLTYA